MRKCLLSVLCAPVFAFGLILPALPLRAEPRTAVYVTSRACQTEGLLSPTECRNAFANAEAEYLDGAPVFNTGRAYLKNFEIEEAVYRSNAEKRLIEL